MQPKAVIFDQIYLNKCDNELEEVDRIEDQFSPSIVLELESIRESLNRIISPPPREKKNPCKHG